MVRTVTSMYENSAGSKTPTKTSVEEYALQNARDNFAVQLSFTKMLGEKKSRGLAFLRHEWKLSQYKGKLNLVRLFYGLLQAIPKSWWSSGRMNRKNLFEMKNYFVIYTMKKLSTTLVTHQKPSHLFSICTCVLGTNVSFSAYSRNTFVSRTSLCYRCRSTVLWGFSQCQQCWFLDQCLGKCCLIFINSNTIYDLDSSNWYFLELLCHFLCVHNALVL